MARKSTLPLTRAVLRGAADYARGDGQVCRPEPGDEERAYLDGWRAAALDDLRARVARAREVAK